MFSRAGVSCLYLLITASNIFFASISSTKIFFDVENRKPTILKADSQDTFCKTSNPPSQSSLNTFMASFGSPLTKLGECVETTICKFFFQRLFQ